MRGLLACAFLIAALPVRGAQSPSEAALGYLQALSAGKTEATLSHDTAISKEITSDRRVELDEQWSLLKHGVKGADLSVLSSREDGDLAAVLVSQALGPDARELDVIALGMIRRDGRWLPAPVPGSFDNTGLNFEPGALRQRARALEEWMLSSRGETLVGLRENAQKTWREKVQKAVPEEVLRNGKPEDLVERLIGALASRDVITVSALLGGTGDAPPPGWDNISAALRSGFRVNDKPSALWGLVTRPQVLRAVVNVDAGVGQTEVAIGCRDPGPERPLRPQVLHFNVVKSSSDLWQVELPEVLMVALNRPEDANEMALEIASEDTDLIEKFPARLREKYPLAPAAGPEEAGEALMAAFRSPSLEKALPLLDLEARPEEIDRAISIWSGLHAPGDHRAMVRLAFLRHENQACGIYQFFSAAASADPQLMQVIWQKGERGWTATLQAQKDFKPPSNDFETLVAKETERFQADWTAGLIARVKAPLAAPVDDAAAKELLARWLACRNANDIGGMLPMLAAIDDEAGIQSVARNLSYEMGDSSHGEVIGVFREGNWVCVAVTDKAATPAYGLYPVVSTPAGPEVLLELYLRGTDGRAGDYLNRRIFARAAEAFPGDTRQQLEACVQKFRATLAKPAEAPAEH